MSVQLQDKSWIDSNQLGLKALQQREENKHWCDVK